MARLARVCIAGQPHVVVQRARPDDQVLADPADSDGYLGCLRESAAVAGVSLHAYALLPSQVRLLVTPDKASALTLMMQGAGRRFIGPYNRRHLRSGALWHGRFQAAAIDPEESFVECLRYVESAPLEAGLVERADDWRWSSAAHHTGRLVVPAVVDHPSLWLLGNTPFEREMAYARLLEAPLAEARVRAIEAAVRRGWALGPAAFVSTVGEQANRRVAPARRGRPPKDR